MPDELCANRKEPEALTWCLCTVTQNATVSLCQRKKLSGSCCVNAYKGGTPAHRASPQTNQLETQRHQFSPHQDTSSSCGHL